MRAVLASLVSILSFALIGCGDSRTKPAITSSGSPTFTEGKAGSYIVTATGKPTPSLTLTGRLPAGVTFNGSNGLLSGTPPAGSAGSYSLEITAHNGVKPDDVQSFTLIVQGPPRITSATSATFIIGTSGAFTVQCTGFPVPSLSVSGALPAGVTFDPRTGELRGTPLSGSSPSYSITFTASNGIPPDFVQSFVLTIESPPAAPSGLRATSVSPDAISISWTDNSANEDGFRIERKGGMESDYREIGITAANVTDYSDAGLLAATAYSYRVRATSAFGDSSYSESLDAKTGPITGIIQLPKTGMTVSYAANDDGDLQRGRPWPEPRFTNPDGSTPVTQEVILDRLTGLMWTRDANAPGPNACGPGGVKTWLDALTYIGCLNSNAYLGYSDWRMPNIREMTSFFNYAVLSWDWLSPPGFMDLPTGYGTYWSSTVDMAYVYDSYHPWFVYSSGAYFMSAYDSTRVWPVRGISPTVPRTGQLLHQKPGDDGDLQSGVVWPNPRFVNPDGSTPINGDLVVDRLTGLMWTKDANTPGPSICGAGTKKTWQAAMDFVACLNSNSYLGYSDWVLPNVNESESLLNFGEASQAEWLNSQGFSNVQASGVYWSSTTLVRAVNPFAFVLSMGGSNTGACDKPFENLVWPVRTNQ